MYTDNPNPIKLSPEDQAVFDEAIAHIEGLIFGEWKESGERIENDRLFSKDFVPSSPHTGRTPKREQRFRIIGKKLSAYSDTEEWKLFDPVSGVQGIEIYKDHRSGERYDAGPRTWGDRRKSIMAIDVYVNGYAHKDSFARTYISDPLVYWNSMNSLKRVIRHELTHAKDPNTSFGTSAIKRKYGYLVYVNDPNRTEFRAHLGEWDEFSKSVQEVMLNKDKNEYYKTLWSIIKPQLCSVIKAKDKTKAFLSLLCGGDCKSSIWADPIDENSIIPLSLRQKIKTNREWADTNFKKGGGAINRLEKALEDRWAAQYRHAMGEWYGLKEKLGKYKWKGLSTKQAQAQVRKDIGDPNASFKKPVKKTKFTKKERRYIQENTRQNFVDMVDAIYRLFRKKGLLDKSLCSEGKSKSDKRVDILMRSVQKDNMIIQALLPRFRALED
tara:strand:+ start:2639 stop:3958 length:1320 start_codon:yes stop_codon:yes gene_type:complete